MLSENGEIVKGGECRRTVWEASKRAAPFVAAMTPAETYGGGDGGLAHTVWADFRGNPLITTPNMDANVAYGK